MSTVFFIPPEQRRLALLAAQSDADPVLIRGGSGTGKSALARWLHANGPRSAKPLIETSRRFDLEEHLLSAAGGTLVVHEIGDYPLSHQHRLLDFLRTRTLSAGTRRIVNVRLIATTGTELDGRTESGLFLPDLLRRLGTWNIEMPPLQLRRDEFDDIVLGVLAELARGAEKDHLRNLSPDAWARIRNHDWPGNIRELRNVLRLAVADAEGDEITADDLPDFMHPPIDFQATREQFEKICALRPAPRPKPSKDLA